MSSELQFFLKRWVLTWEMGQRGAIHRGMGEGLCEMQPSEPEIHSESWRNKLRRDSHCASIFTTKYSISLPFSTINW
jgi:hypothetical protein